MKSNIKKVISLVLCLALLLAMTTNAFAIETSEMKIAENQDVFTLGGFDYYTTVSEDGSVLVKTIKDGIVYNEAEYVKDEGNIYYTDYHIEDSSARTTAAESPKKEVEVFPISAIISCVEEPDVIYSAPQSASANVNYSYLRTVKYNPIWNGAQNIYYSAQFNYSILSTTYNGTYTVNAGAGTVISIIVAAVVGALAWPAGAVYVFLSGALGGVVGYALDRAISYDLSGTVYDYAFKIVSPELGYSYYDTGVYVQTRAYNKNTGNIDTGVFNDGVTAYLVNYGDEYTAYNAFMRLYSFGWPGVNYWYY